MLKHFGDRSFSVAAPRLWNVLPVELRKITSLSAFKSRLKHIFLKLPLLVYSLLNDSIIFLV